MSDAATDDYAEVADFYRARRFSQRTGFGAKPALLIIDMSYAFTNPEHPLGADLDHTVASIAELLAVFREQSLPVYFTTTAYNEADQDAGMFGRKIPSLYELRVGSPDVEIDDRLQPVDGEPVILKKYPSSFFATNLSSLLQVAGVDTIVLSGCSTSGCIRAAALDGNSFGFRIVVPEECVADRAEPPHRANLFDIDAKYGDVMPLADVIDHLRTAPTP